MSQMLFYKPYVHYVECAPIFKGLDPMLCYAYVQFKDSPKTLAFMAQRAEKAAQDKLVFSRSTGQQVNMSKH
mgnify:CR=1 FL=1